MSDETRRREDERVREHEQILREASDTPLARDMARERESAESLHVRAQERREAAPAAAEPSAERMAAEAAEFAREQAALGPEGRAARAQHRRAAARTAADSARRTTPEQQARLIRVAGLGMALAGVFLLLQGLQQQGLVKDPLPSAAPSAAAATATPPPPSPVAQASPQVNGTGTATASFSKVSGPCKLAAQFTDRYAFAATGGALTLTQLSDDHVTTGRIEVTGDFTTTAAGQSYKGRVTGTTATGQHFYTAEGCNEVYAFTMTFPTPLIAAPVVVPATIAAAVITPTPPPAASAVVPAPSPTTPTGGPNVALAALGLILTVGGIGVATRGPALLRSTDEGDRDA